MFCPASKQLRVILDKQVTAPTDVAVLDLGDASGTVSCIYVADPEQRKVTHGLCIPYVMTGTLTACICCITCPKVIVWTPKYGMAADGNTRADHNSTTGNKKINNPDERHILVVVLLLHKYTHVK